MSISRDIAVFHDKRGVFMTLHKDEQLKFCHRVLELHIDLFGDDAGSLSDGLTRRGLGSQLLFQQVVWDDNKKPSKLHITVHREGNPPIGRFPSQRPSNVERVSTPWLHNGRIELAYSFVPVGLLVYVVSDLFPAGPISVIFVLCASISCNCEFSFKIEFWSRLWIALS